jgi:hypothetical protein
MQFAFLKEHDVLLYLLGIMIPLRRMTRKKSGVARFATWFKSVHPNEVDHLEDLSVDER